MQQTTEPEIPSYRLYTTDPPPYEEAIAHQVSSSVSTPSTVVHVTPREELETDVLDYDDEQDYEESRPFKYGTIPSGSAQYTYIQPQDHTQQKWWNGCKSHWQRKNHYQKSDRYHHLDHDHDRHRVGPTPVLTLASNQQQHPSNTGKPHTLLVPTAPSLTEIACGGSSAAALPIPEPFATASVGCSTMYTHETNADTGSTSKNDQSPPYDNRKYAPASASESCQQSESQRASTVHPSATTSCPSSAKAEIYAGVPMLSNTGEPAQTLMSPQDISIASFKRTADGDVSSDPILERDAYQLYRYFVAHNDRPELYVLITGTHKETRETTSTDSKGKTTTETSSYDVEDFRIEFDLTPFVTPRGLLQTTPNRNTSQARSFCQVFEEHAQDDNEFKEMHMEKTVEWDFDELGRALIYAVRSAYYHHDL
ncbi:hypothetical protein BGZ94_004024 [Podila epigama]|nr:hypothetical protein BGZ94_004024 [Podila epigama]